MGVINRINCLLQCDTHARVLHYRVLDREPGGGFDLDVEVASDPAKPGGGALGRRGGEGELFDFGFAEEAHVLFFLVRY